MTARKNKIDSMIKELEELVTFKDDEERIEIKASFLQIDILKEVKTLMEEKNISRTELAQKLKKSKSFISQLFSGDKALNLKMIAQFQEIFDAKFIPSFKDYSEYRNSKKYNRNDYLNKMDYEKIAPIFKLSEYEEQNEAA